MNTIKDQIAKLKSINWNQQITDLKPDDFINVPEGYKIGEYDDKQKGYPLIKLDDKQV